MKKFSVSLLALALVLSLTACGDDTPPQADTTPAADTTAEEDTAADNKDNTASVPTTDASSALAEQPEAPKTPAAPENTAQPPAEAAEKDPPHAPAPEPAATPTLETPAPAPTDPAPTEAASENAASAVSLSDVRDQILSELSITDYMEITTDRLLDLYGIQQVDLAQSASFATMSGVFPGEIILVEATDADAASRVAALLQNRLTEVLNQYKTYDAETYALAEACTVDLDGNIVSMFLSPDRSKMRGILTDSLH